MFGLELRRKSAPGAQQVNNFTEFVPDSQPNTEPMAALPRQLPVQQMPMEEEEESAAGWWIKIIILVADAIAICAFAVQTWQLVNTIFPSDNQFMKVSTVACLDVMSLIFALTEMSYPFKSKHAKYLAFGMWLITFVGALAASMIYMYLSSIKVLHGVVDMSVLVWAYGVVVIVMSADVLSITIGIRMEVEAHKKAKALARKQRIYSPAQTQVQPVYSPAQVTPEMEMMKMMFALMQSQSQGGTQQAQLPLAQPTQQNLTAPTPKQTPARVNRAGATAGTQPTKKSLPKRKSI